MSAAGRGVTVVVPTFREGANLPALLDRLERVREETGLDLELLVMDDRSRDGSVEAVERRGVPWARIVERSGERSLSAAVVEGFALARNSILVVMDADLSHPPEAIPLLLAELDRGCDFAIASRFVPGGSVDRRWGWRRRVMSRVARLLARPLTDVRDPGTGFFAFRRSLLEQADPLRPVGFKIGLEFLVKGRCRRVGEVPIHFADRRAGTSKLRLKAQLDYLRHLLRLYRYRSAR